jgi:hypothetical protein
LFRVANGVFGTADHAGSARQRGLAKRGPDYQKTGNFEQES